MARLDRETDGPRESPWCSRKIASVGAGCLPSPRGRAPTGAVCLAGRVELAEPGDHTRSRQLINSAGILRDNLPFKMSVVEWNAVMALHLHGPFLVSPTPQTFMAEEGFGRRSSCGCGRIRRGNVNRATGQQGNSPAIQALVMCRWVVDPAGRPAHRGGAQPKGCTAAQDSRQEVAAD